MPNLNLTLPDYASVCEGKQVTFKAPCDCINIDNIIIGDSTYQLRDAKGETPTDAWVEGALVTLLLDSVNHIAYLLGGGYGGVKTHANTHKTGGSDELKPSDIGAENAASIVAYTLLASGWSNNEYSFETEYSTNDYNLEISLNGDSVTEEQKEAFDFAQLVGFASANKLKAFGTVPTVDIPIILKVVKK